MAAEPTDPPVSGEIVEARVHRAPRYGAFMMVGAVLGLIAAGIIAAIGDYEPSPTLNVVYSPTQVFGFALLWTLPVGVALGGVVALLIERATRGRERVVRVDHERIHVQPDTED